MLRVQDLLINQKTGRLSPQNIRSEKTKRVLQKNESAAKPFSEILDKKIDNLQTPELQFSAHAVHRLKERNIFLSDNDISRLRTGLNNAARKGANNSLMVLDNHAFIINIKNKMVVTAIDGSMTANHVFTNIDSAAIV